MSITLHRPLARPTTLDALVAAGALAEHGALALYAAVRRPTGALILVVGNTATGKTTITSCIATAAGMSRPVVSTVGGGSVAGELQLHRRAPVLLDARLQSPPGLAQVLEAVQRTETDYGTPPVLVSDEDEVTLEWMLRVPAAQRLTRIATVHGGSASGALARLSRGRFDTLDHLADGPLTDRAVADAVDLVVHCDRGRDRRTRLTVHDVAGLTGDRFQLRRLVD